MSNIALIVAGGNGSRAGQDVPKQYLTVYETPIIVYTMLNIQESGLFDEMYVVCSNGRSDFIISYAKQYAIHLFKETVEAGKTRFDSMYNGIKRIKEIKGLSGDMVCLFDANRPLIPHQVMDKAMAKIKESDCVVSLAPCYDSMYYANSERQIVTGSQDRSCLFMGQAPEVATLSSFFEVLSSCEDNDKNSPMAEIMLKQGKKVSFVEGSSKSMKITTADDFAIFKSLLGDKKRDSLKTSL